MIVLDHSASMDDDTIEAEVCEDLLILGWDVCGIGDNSSDPDADDSGNWTGGSGDYDSEADDD